MQIESLEHEIKPLVSDNDGRFSTTSSTLGNLKVAFRYVLAETAKDKKNFIVGVITVFIVVFSISLLENTIENSPVLFLKLAEDNIGEVDLILTPNFRVNKYFLNQSEIDNALQRESLVVGTTPRWVLLTKIINANKINRNASTILLIIDSAREKEIGLGRQWSHPPLNHNQTHVSRSLLRQIGVRPNNNEEVLLRFDLISILHTLAASKQTEVDFVNSILQNFFEYSNGFVHRKWKQRVHTQLQCFTLWLQSHLRNYSLSSRNSTTKYTQRFLCADLRRGSNAQNALVS